MVTSDSTNDLKKNDFLIVEPIGRAGAGSLGRCHGGRLRQGRDSTVNRMRWGGVLAALALGLLAVSVTSSPAVAVAGHGSKQRLHGGAFFSNCLFSHAGNDDPIVLPHRSGRSHAHTFFGNVSTNAHSTVRSLRRAETTCRIGADTAAYWIPTLYQGGREVRPVKAQLYYVMRGYGQMRAFPAGLKVVSGDAAARRPQARHIAYWACGGGGGVRSAASATVPTCTSVRMRYMVVVKRCPSCAPVRTRRDVRKQTFLELHVNFPDCWNGRDLDSADHISHMAYSRQYRCPASHPVKVPLIRLNVQYPTKGGNDVELASGGQFSGHADFFNAWDQDTLERLVAECFRDRCIPAIAAIGR
jgi:hypothetical protein